MACPELKALVVKNKNGGDTIDFSNADGVKLLNRAILKHYYGIGFWDIPRGFLCPPIPGRADYIHTVADLIGQKKAHVLDVGVGANCVYPLIGISEYGWSFVGSEIDKNALDSANTIVQKNNLESQIEIRLQSTTDIFKGIIRPGEFYDLTISNPPFHESLAEARGQTSRKWKNLKKKDVGLNFGGQEAELWVEGGERGFIHQIMSESLEFKSQCRWFTTLVSKEANLIPLTKMLKTLNPADVRVLELRHGQKKSRILCWHW